MHAPGASGSKVKSGVGRSGTVSMQVSRDQSLTQAATHPSPQVSRASEASYGSLSTPLRRSWTGCCRPAVTSPSRIRQTGPFPVAEGEQVRDTPRMARWPEEGAGPRYEGRPSTDVQPHRGPAVSDPVSYTAVLPVRESTVAFASGLLAAERRRRGTRGRRRALGCYRQAGLGLRWVFGGTRLAPLAAHNPVGPSAGLRELPQGDG